MSPSLSLESVQADFDLWRQSKKAPQCRCPDTLRQKALALRAQYTRREIAKALNITPQRLSCWESPKKTAEVKSSSPVEFVQLSEPAKPVPPAPESTPLRLTGTHTNGTQWSLQGDFSPAQLRALIATLTTSNGGER